MLSLQDLRLLFSIMLPIILIGLVIIFFFAFYGPMVQELGGQINHMTELMAKVGVSN